MAAAAEIISWFSLTKIDNMIAFYIDQPQWSIMGQTVIVGDMKFEKYWTNLCKISPATLNQFWINVGPPSATLAQH